ncbi:glucoamylase family protein [Reyranella sp.]|uniref:glucoamylase family protein n=1 Tax=Reyranella sp. TaxID=1929291 RepID=UPI00345DFB56
MQPHSPPWSILQPPSPISSGWTAWSARARYGFYEAIDFTPSRLPDGEFQAIVRAYMAHHQGMVVVAIANALLDGVMRSRFHHEPKV